MGRQDAHGERDARGQQGRRERARVLARRQAPRIWRCTFTPHPKPPSHWLTIHLPPSPSLDPQTCAVKREDRTLRRGRVQAHHVALVLPQRPRQLPLMDRGRATLRVGLARYARLYLER